MMDGKQCMCGGKGSCGCGSNGKSGGCCGGAHMWLHFIVKLLVIVGGLNWGLIAINPDWNVVHMLLGQWAQVERVVYGLVGLAALKMFVFMVIRMCGGCCGGKCEKK